MCTYKLYLYVYLETRNQYNDDKSICNIHIHFLKWGNSYKFKKKTIIKVDNDDYHIHKIIPGGGAWSTVKFLID